MANYWSNEFGNIQIEKTEVYVEIFTRNGKFNSEFVGENAPVQAIDFVNGVKQMLGKERIIRISMSTYTYNHEVPEE